MEINAQARVLTFLRLQSKQRPCCFHISMRKASTVCYGELFSNVILFFSQVALNFLLTVLLVITEARAADVDATWPPSAFNVLISRGINLLQLDNSSGLVHWMIPIKNTSRTPAVEMTMTV